MSGRTFCIEPRPYSDPDITRLVAEVQAHYVEIYGGPDEAVVEVGEFVEPQGLMLVGLLDDEAVAMGGWRRLPDDHAACDGGVATAACDGGVATAACDGGVATAACDGGVATAACDGGVATAEVKRMYVTPSAQRRGLARLMLAAVERTAARAGVERLVLNTGPNQRAAIALYERSGYEPSPAFGYYAEHGEALFFAKTLPTGVRP